MKLFIHLLELTEFLNFFANRISIMYVLNTIIIHNLKYRTSVQKLITNQCV